MAADTEAKCTTAIQETTCSLWAAYTVYGKLVRYLMFYKNSTAALFVKLDTLSFVMRRVEVLA